MSMLEEIETIVQRVREFAEEQNQHCVTEEVHIDADAKALHPYTQLLAPDVPLTLMQCRFTVDLRNIENDHRLSCVIFLLEAGRLRVERTTMYRG